MALRAIRYGRVLCMVQFMYVEYHKVRMVNIIKYRISDTENGKNTLKDEKHTCTRVFFVDLFSCLKTF